MILNLKCNDFVYTKKGQQYIGTSKDDGYTVYYEATITRKFINITFDTTTRSLNFNFIDSYHNEYWDYITKKKLNPDDDYNKEISPYMKLCNRLMFDNGSNMAGDGRNPPHVIPAGVKYLYIQPLGESYGPHSSNSIVNLVPCIVSINDKGIIKQSSNLSVNDKGIIKQASALFVNDNGIIKQGGI